MTAAAWRGRSRPAAVAAGRMEWRVYESWAVVWLLLLLLGCESARKLGYWCLGRCGLQLKKHETFFFLVFLKEEHETILTYLLLLV